MYLQQLMLLGRATKDAEIKESKNGKAYARFGLAVNEYKGKDNEDQTTFYDVFVFNKSSENATRIKKGQVVMVEGKPEVDAYIASDGTAKGQLVVFANKWKTIPAKVQKDS